MKILHFKSPHVSVQFVYKIWVQKIRFLCKFTESKVVITVSIAVVSLKFNRFINPLFQTHSVMLQVIKYRVRQRGCSLTHSARTTPAVHPRITIWVDDIEIEILLKQFFCRGDFFGGGSFTPMVFCTNILVRVKLGYALNVTFLGHLVVVGV